MPRRSLGKNHLTELPLTSERMRSPARSLAYAVFFIIGEERMVDERSCHSLTQSNAKGFGGRGREGRGERLNAPRPILKRPTLKMHLDSMQMHDLGSTHQGR